MSTFQDQWSGTGVENFPIQHGSLSRFGLVFHNDDTDDTEINFQLHGVAAGFDITTPMDEDMEMFTMYEVTRRLLWEPNNPSHAKNDKLFQFLQGA